MTSGIDSRQQTPAPHSALDTAFTSLLTGVPYRKRKTEGIKVLDKETKIILRKEVDSTEGRSSQEKASQSTRSKVTA
jgi:hypothetical protein